MGAAPLLKYSIAEYLEAESTALDKHEFYKGELFAMAGRSIQHNQITRNALSAIDGQLKNGNTCQVFPSDLKILCEANSLFTYPDLSIICGNIETLPEHEDVVTNPTVIIEVLSASTQDYDRGSKFKLYRDIPSLKTYVLISSLEILVEKYDRQPDSTWILHEYKNMNESFSITVPDVAIEVETLYRNVEFASKIQGL